MFVLWAEDSQRDRHLIEEALREVPGSREVRFMGDGNSLLAEARRQRPDLVVLDISLGMTDGIETLAQMRREAAMADVPVVVFSSILRPGDEQTCKRLGARACIEKPVDFDGFCRAVRRILDKPGAAVADPRRQNPPPRPA